MTIKLTQAPHLTRIVQCVKNAVPFISRPEGFFLTFSALFGFMFVFLTPPMQVYDERVHFLQAYAVSNLDFVPHKLEFNGQYHYGAELPRSVFVAARTFLTGPAGDPKVKFNTHLYQQYIAQPLRPSATAHEDAGTAYSPIAYTPQAVGIAIGKIFNASPLIMIWLGRLANLTAWIAIVYLAIRLLPFGKWALVILALNPMAVFLSASLSADVMTTALAFLFFGLVAGAMVGEGLISRRQVVSLLAVSVLMSLTKPTNIVFGLLLFAIPWRKFITKWRYVAMCLAAIGTMVLVALAWNHLVAAASLFTAQTQSVGNNPSLQLSGIIHAPWTYAKDILLNYVLVPAGYPGNFVLTASMGVLGWGEVNVPMWAIYLYVMTFILALLYSVGRGSVLSRVQKTILVSVFVLFVLGNITAMYIYLTGVGKQIIQGVQGRYFIPGMPLLTGIPTAHKRVLLTSKTTFAITLCIMMIVVLGASILTILFRYY